MKKEVFTVLKKRFELLMEEKEYLYLRNKADEKNRSIGELIREAVREKYLYPDQQKRETALQKIQSGDYALPTPVEWYEIEDELNI